MATVRSMKTTIPWSEVNAIIAPPNKKYLTFDIMDAVTERFICTMKMPNTP